MKVVLLSTYELGRQPFGLASPAAWLRARGHEVRCVDLAVDTAPDAALRDAQLIAFYLPMHTATRLAARLIPQLRELNPGATLCAYGLYAPMNAEYLRDLGIGSILGGEFEGSLAALADGQPVGGEIVFDRLKFIAPDRAGLPALGRYAKLRIGNEERVVGSTEASRGCKHLCRHCPVVPVYRGTFRVVQADVVLADVRQQVAAGARHITFGDPDFFNGPAHATRIVEALAREFPGLTYDVTIKIEHLLKHRDLLPLLRDTGCAFVTSAVESVDDTILEKFAKGHTRRDFELTVEEFRRVNLALNPTFIAFTPWTTRAGYRELLRSLRELDLVDQTSSIQLALRLLIPAGSLLLELDEIREWAGAFDSVALVHPWQHADPEMDELARLALSTINQGQRAKLDRRAIFGRLWRMLECEALPEDFGLMPRATVPYLDEPWYC